MLASFHGAQGDFPRQLRHLDRFFEKDPKDPVLLCLGWHEKVRALTSLGRMKGRAEAVEEYGRRYSPEVAASAGLQYPKAMAVWLLIDSGKYEAADRLLGEIAASGEASADPSLAAASGLAKAEIEFRAHRDPKKPKAALLRLMDPGQLGPQRFLSDPGLLVAAVICEERLFRAEEAIALIRETKGADERPSAVVPQAELARNELLLCHWDKAAEDLSKARKIVMTYPSWIRAEAAKNLDFAVADYCLAAGHPAEALVILQRLDTDFLRPGFSTESEEYFRGGLHLRIRMACDRVLGLQMACISHAPPWDVLRSLPGLVALSLQRWKSEVLFRDALFTTARTAYPGRDLGTIVFAPAWMIPEMRVILGKAAFGSLAARFAPEGRRLEILSPLIDGKGAPVQGTPPLLGAVILAAGDEVSGRIRAWQSCRSSPLIAGKSLPVAQSPTGLPVCGWMARHRDGLNLSVQESVTGSATISLVQGSDALRVSVQWPPSIEGKIESFNHALLNADPHWNSERLMMIEGRNINPGVP